MFFEFASDQIQGKRAAQEDSLGALMLISDAAPANERKRAGRADELVLVVADGMGGHVGGRIASSLSSQSFLDTIDGTRGEWQDRLEQALLAANEALRTQTDMDPDLVGMGSTLVGAVLNQNGLGWVSVGDSGLYLCRNGELLRLNEDHSFGYYLDQQARDGLIPAEVAAVDRRRNQLFHALLGDPLDHYERFRGFRLLRDGDMVLLASDGLKTLSDERIATILSDGDGVPAEDLVRRLLGAVEAENLARQDNTSLILVRVHEPDPQPERTQVPAWAAERPTEPPPQRQPTPTTRPAPVPAPKAAPTPPPGPSQDAPDMPTTRVPPPAPPGPQPAAGPSSPPPVGPAAWHGGGPHPQPSATPAARAQAAPQHAPPARPSLIGRSVLIAVLAVAALAIVALLLWRIWPR